jgi:signal transduction histidine kinase/CheY-like chemotaxis protein
LHPPLLVILEAITVLMCGAMLFVARTSGTERDPIPWLGAGLFLNALGLVIVVLPGPMFITRGLGVAMVLSGGSFAWIALRQFFDKSPRWDVAAVGPLLWLLVTRLPAVANDPGWQMMFSWGIGAFYMVILTWALRPDGTEYLPARTSALIFLGIHGIVFALRAFLAGTGLDGQYRDLLSNILIIEGQFRVIGTSFLVLALTKQRAENIAARNLEAAERASDARRRFVAQMSHEVRTPLNGVFGLAQVLAQDSRLLPDQREHAQALEIAGRHLLSIVNDALDLAKIDADRLEPASRAFDPASTTEDCLALLRPNALDKRITLRFEPDSALPLRVLGDQTRLQQILLNLLSNALKFTPERGSVTLRTVTLPAGLRFDIIDTGPGVPPDQRHLLFKDFSQLDPSTSEGTGLGLAISARLAERLGGSLRYVPREDTTGSIFRLMVPWTEAPGDPRRRHAPPVPTTNALHLLVVDDVQVNRVVLRAMLTGAAHTVSEARGGREALGLIHQHHYDMILLDIRMPDIDGLEVTTRLRAMPGWTSEVPIIGVSADAMPETIQACLAAGMDAVLPKPVESAALLSELQRLRTHRHAPAAARGSGLRHTSASGVIDPGAGVGIVAGREAGPR